MKYRTGLSGVSGYPALGPNPTTNENASSHRRIPLQLCCLPVSVVSDSRSYGFQELRCQSTPCYRYKASGNSRKPKWTLVLLRVSESAAVLPCRASNADAAKSAVTEQNPVGSAQLTTHLRVHMQNVIFVLPNMQNHSRKRVSDGTELQTEQPSLMMLCLVLPPLRLGFTAP